MRGGDISNKQAPYVMFDIDSLLFLEKEKRGLRKFLDKFKSEDEKYLEREFDKSFIRLLQSVWQRHNVCIGLVTFELLDDDCLLQLQESLDSNFVPYTMIFGYYEWDSLRDFGHSIYTFSANENLLSYLSRKDALHIDKIREVLG